MNIKKGVCVDVASSDSTLCVFCLKTMIPFNFYIQTSKPVLAFVAEIAGLSLSYSAIPNIGFLVTIVPVYDRTSSW